MWGQRAVALPRRRVRHAGPAAVGRAELEDAAAEAERAQRQRGVRNRRPNGVARDAASHAAAHAVRGGVYGHVQHGELRAGGAHVEVLVKDRLQPVGAHLVRVKVGVRVRVE